LPLEENCDVSHSISTSELPIDEWRRSISHWAFRVIDHFRLDRDIVAYGLMILERFLATYRPLMFPDSEGSHHHIGSDGIRRSNGVVDSATYQLAAMSCVYLAIKLHVDTGSEDDHARRKHFRVETFAELSRGMFTVRDISDMELTILQTLGWKVSGAPTPMTLVNYFLHLMPEHRIVSSPVSPSASQRLQDLVLHVLRELSRYLTELVVSIGSECARYLPSQVAYASIVVSMELLTPQALPISVRERLSRRILNLCPWSKHSAGGREAHRAIDAITAVLKRTLWPEMLLDDGERTSDPGHPISMARECGILNLAYSSVTMTASSYSNCYEGKSSSGENDETCAKDVCRSAFDRDAAPSSSSWQRQQRRRRRRRNTHQDYRRSSWDTDSGSGGLSPVGVERLAHVQQLV
jgi:hypothetical protein